MKLTVDDIAELRVCVGRLNNESDGHFMQFAAQYDSEMFAQWVRDVHPLNLQRILKAYHELAEKVLEAAQITVKLEG